MRKLLPKMGSFTAQELFVGFVWARTCNCERYKGKGTWPRLAGLKFTPKRREVDPKVPKWGQESLKFYNLPIYLLRLLLRRDIFVLPNCVTRTSPQSMTSSSTLVMTNRKVGRDKDFRQSLRVALDDDTADKWQTEPNVLPGSSTQPWHSSIPVFGSFCKQLGKVY